MSDDDFSRPTEPPEPAPAPAEARLGDLLTTLRDNAPEPGHALAMRVVRRARWQRSLRAAISVVTQFAGAAGSIGRLLMGKRAGRA